MHSDTCEHLRDTYPHTGLDGLVTTIPYCRRCGMEWQEQMDRELSAPVVRLHMKGHPAPYAYNGLMAVAWGWLSWQGVNKLAAMDGNDYIGRFVAAWITLMLMAMVFLNLAVMSTHRARCKKFHAAQHVIMAALDAYPVTEEETKAILEARRG